MITERTLLSFNFKNTFISIPLNVFNIEAEEESDIDELENFNTDIWIYLTLERKHEKFIVIGVNLNIVRNDGKEYPYNENDLYLKLNNAGYNDII